MPDEHKANVFPVTRCTWIEEELKDGQRGRLNVNRHIMDVYAWPLKVYFLAFRDRWIGEPEDVIQGFFASRLGKPGFFEDWQSSGKRLHRWLMNGLCFYVKELHRERMRLQREVPDIPDNGYDDTSAADTMDRAFVQGIVREALVDAEALCASRGLHTHWKIFVEHYIRGDTYDQIARTHAVEPTRAVVMARTATRKFQSALRLLIERNGSAVDELDTEIEMLLNIARVNPKAQPRREQSPPASQKDGDCA
jgi:DNA-directed RNA polymerase specialized sigma24 family protein